MANISRSEITDAGAESPGVSRRVVLQSALALSAAGLLLSRPARAATTLDVLVIGAGLSGLNAALLLQEQGLRVRVLEGRNLVAAGAGVSVVPASMQGAHPHAVAYCPLADATPLDAPMTLVWRRADQAGPTATFVALARRMALDVATDRAASPQPAA